MAAQGTVQAKRRKVSDKVKAQSLAEDVAALEREELEAGITFVTQALRENPKLLLPLKACVKNGGKIKLISRDAIGQSVRTPPCT